MGRRGSHCSGVWTACLAARAKRVNQMLSQVGQWSTQPHTYAQSSSHGCCGTRLGRNTMSVVAAVNRRRECTCVRSTFTMSTIADACAGSKYLRAGPPKCV